jgi:hypothetical protein
MELVKSIPDALFVSKQGKFARTTAFPLAS